MAIIYGKIFSCLCCSAAAFLAAATPAPAGEKLFESVQVTPAGEYTSGIEGPAVDLDGNLYVVNFGRQGTIGMLAPGSLASDNFIELPEGSVGNSIRFARDGTMFIADYKKHNIFAIKKGSRVAEVWFHSDQMHQPNDMTIARDGTIYASDPNWKEHSGQIWRIWKGLDGSVQGQVMTAPRTMGTTNGIDLSPDEKTLYVGESGSGQIWSYSIHGSALGDAKLIKTFERNTIDGIRTDMTGKLLIARILNGTIAVVTPGGLLQREIALKNKEPSNLAFGGNDGRTVFVTQRQGGFIESFRSDNKGREYCLQKTDCR
ncbi:signal peptidase, endoplasmic reticulum-type [Bradyrhizobium sp. NFR13]|uniref:SMP-30/gluconolactonase/LRE family protein n=1 Tax=Bradyrhizobium sp. NFR13 TaxID=1566285 RepID=UPI0008E44808|nr:SMP-30/gluconolactonase/LRE family protein [Bradyrhizobium sp. NFR13]SFM11710.1 signal peptidase, endoplasmic reticulum-type [Bradyrhizobium sp. NFR13]